ncbi:hypothetical protein O1611_g8648 [Lasiodiplodia mahajangana]|uniref:Uncharacterized protein n=1 Tax=Lasiodiplodia mahajangana TaxID=1108764 RepID=A0ACC2JC34_9PEZI|nr:hypothetical protein O1611_g8648 [Lasiodiplodia mahajangana]
MRTKAMMSPREGDASKNERHCYDESVLEIHVRLDNMANRFCNGLGEAGDVLYGNTAMTRDFAFDQTTTVATITFSMDVELRPVPPVHQRQRRRL